MSDKNNEYVNEGKRTAEELVKAMEQFITTKSVVGEPIRLDDTIILPLANVSFGMGVGTFTKGETGTGGIGGKITPTAVLICKSGTSKLISVKDTDGLTKIIDMIPDVVNKITDIEKSKVDAAIKAAENETEVDEVDIINTTVDFEEE